MQFQKNILSALSSQFECHSMHEKFYVYSTTGLTAQVVTREVIMENEIVDLNVLFLNLNNIFQVLFTIYIPTINAAFAAAGS